jgi:colicin import membrane protein
MNALVTIDTLTPAVVFAPGGVEGIISKLEADVRAVATDISTDAGRKAVASLAYKVARSKTALDEMGKDLVADLKAQTGKIDAERRIIRDRLDALRDEVRKPLDDFENAEKDRVAAHERALAAIAQYVQVSQLMAVPELKQALEDIGKIAQRDWQEFSARATATVDEVRKMLGTTIAQTEKRDAEAAELVRLRAEQVAREQADREDRIAAEAAERARMEAESKAKREAEEAAAKAEAERKRVEKDKADAIARAEKAEADKKAAAAKAARDAKEAAEAAERNRLASIEAERKRAADAAAKEAAEKAHRETDKAHRAKFNNEALAVLQSLGLEKETGMAVLAAIARGEVPHVSINY